MRATFVDGRLGEGGGRENQDKQVKLEIGQGHIRKRKPLSYSSL